MFHIVELEEIHILLQFLVTLTELDVLNVSFIPFIQTVKIYWFLNVMNWSCVGSQELIHGLYTYFIWSTLCKQLSQHIDF